MSLVLVLDLDETITDSSPELFLPAKEEIIIDRIKRNLNMNIINLLIRASRLRSTGGVAAICLLTNNLSKPFITLVDKIILELTGSGGSYGNYAVSDGYEARAYFFDYIMSRDHASRPKLSSPPKRIEDVNYMLGQLKLPLIDDTNINRLYFFDDSSRHALRESFVAGKSEANYITITPPYSKYGHDTTNYNPILLELAKLDGGEPVLPKLAQSPLQALISSAPRVPLPPSSIQRSQAPQRGSVSLAAAPGRPRSKVGINAANLGLLPPENTQYRALRPEQERTIHGTSSSPRSTSPSLANMFKRPPGSGGSRKTRRRYRRRRFTKRIR